MKLKLQRPLAIFDLETTGVNVTQDRIVEIAIIKLNPDGSEEQFSKRVNPGVAIPLESSLIHGIYDNDVVNEPSFEALADEVAAFIGDADLGGYNSNKFDIPVLAEEFLRINHSFDVSQRRFVDVQNIFHKMEQRTLAAAFQFYCGSTMENAHNALYDTQVTVDVFRAQLEKYESLPDNVAELADFSRQGNMEWYDFAGRLAKDEKGRIIYNFGKHKGKSVEELHKTEPGYFGWMLDADFPLYTKQLLRKEMDRIRAERQKNQPQNTAPRKEFKREEESSQSMEDKLAALKNKFGSQK